jgi:hypothetical protein
VTDCSACTSGEICCGGTDQGICAEADTSAEECSALVCDTCGDEQVCVTHWVASLVDFSCQPNPCAPDSLGSGVGDECSECAATLCGGEVCRASDGEVQCIRRCAAPDTPIATPEGERAIASLKVGDLVYSVDGGVLRSVPIVALRRLPARQHQVMRVVLASGSVLEISASHPTADGRDFAELRAGDLLDSTRIVASELVPYVHDFTYDILPGSDSGTYVAGGALIGSTLFPGSVAVIGSSR